MMGNYSLQDSLLGVGLTPLGEDIMRDPRAASRMATDLSGMSAYTAQEPGVLLDAEPAGIATAQPGSTFLSATPEDDTNIVMKTIGTVLGAPFNLLRGAKEGLEDAIGHPYAMQRDAQDEQYAMLASVLSDSDKAAMGMPVDRTGVNARQTNTSTVATGNNYGISPTLTPRKTGIVELLTGESRKQRALQMAKLQAALKAQGVNLNIEAIKTGIYKDAMAGDSQRANALKTDYETQLLYRYGDRQNEANIDAQVANAQQSRAGAFNQTQQGLTHRQTRPGLVRSANANALDAEQAAQRNEELFRKVTLPGGIEGIDRNQRQFWDITYPAGLEANNQAVATGRRADEGFSIWKDLQGDERRQKEAESNVRVQRDIAGIENNDLRTAAGVDYLKSRTALTGAQTTTETYKQENLDSKTRAITDIAAASIDRIYAQIGSFADASRLATARARLDEIRGDTLLNQDQRDAAFSDVRRALMETRMDLARQAQTNNDLMTKAKIQFIDKDIARLESIISLNGAREGAVGQDSSLDGGSSFGKALLGQAGKESNANLNALLGSAADDVGTVYDRANRYEMLGYEYGKDYGIVKGERPWFGTETPDRIVFPKGSRLKGAAKGVQEAAPAARIMAPKEKTANPSPAFDDEKPAAVQSRVMQGQTSRAMNGRAADVLRKYPTPESVVAAQKAGKITFEEGASALDALGVARRPRT